jgi:hypothetical protein
MFTSTRSRTWAFGIAVAVTAVAAITGMSPVSTSWSAEAEASGRGSAIQTTGKDVVDDRPDGEGSSGDDAIFEIAAWRDRNPDLLTSWAGMARDGDTVTVYWAREVPWEFQSFLAIAELTSVKVAVSPFSHRDLGAAIRALATAHPEVPMWSASADFSGVVATVPEGVRVPRFDDAPVPVQVRRGESKWVNFLGRGDDTSPFYGGSQIFRTTPSGSTALCSTGFPVEFSGGAIRMVTARHCGTNATFRSPEDEYSTWPSTRRVVGTSGGGHAATDSVLLAPSSTDSYFYRVYTGAWNSISSRTIVGTLPPVLGDGVCAGGGWSGQQCSNVITDVNVYVSEGGISVGPGFVATNSSVAQAGSGDSGSPAVKLASSALTLRIAGLLKGGSESALAPCQGWEGASPRQCSRMVLYIEVAAILSQHNVSLHVSP